LNRWFARIAMRRTRTIGNALSLINSAKYAAALAANTFRFISINASIAPKNQFSFGHVGPRHTGAHC
jgi:hypothetical protein